MIIPAKDSNRLLLPIYPQIYYNFQNMAHFYLFIKIVFLSPHFVFSGLTPQITGGKKQSDEGAVLFAVRVYLPCYMQLRPTNLIICPF